MKLKILSVIAFVVMAAGTVMAQEEQVPQKDFAQALAELEAKHSKISYIGTSSRIDSKKGFELETNMTTVATNEQLDSLALHAKMPATRILAYYTLLWYRKGQYCSKLLPKMLADDEMVVIDAQQKTTTVNRFVATQSCMKKGVFDNRGIELLDSMFICYPDIRTKGYYAEALKRCKGVPKYYKIFSKLYDDGDSLMLPYVAVYKNENDIPKIITALKEYPMGQAEKPELETETDLDEYGRTNEALSAIIEWPSGAFVPALEEMGKYMFARKGYFYIRGQFYFMALMSYDNPWSYKVIERCLKKKKLLPYYSRIFTEAFKFMGRKPRYMPLIEKYGDQQVLNYNASIDD